MTERVGGVIQSAVLAHLNELMPPAKAIEIARAVIAVMRSPTEAMTDAGENVEPVGEHYTWNAAAIWDAMIDAALKP